jgi:hypothetical protein
VDVGTRSRRRVLAGRPRRPLSRFRLGWVVHAVAHFFIPFASPLESPRLALRGRGGLGLDPGNPRPRLQRERRRWARRLIVVGAGLVLVAGVRSTVLAASPATQPTNLVVSLPLPTVLQAGMPLRQAIAATGQAIFGCYRWRARGLPTGLRIAKTVTCVPPGHVVSVLGNAVVGAPLSAPPATETTVTVQVVAIGPSPEAKIRPRPAGIAAISVIVLPSPWVASGSPRRYQGAALTAVSCLAGPSCWVVGQSDNPPSPGTAKTPVPPTGQSPPSASGTSSTRSALLPGGTFVAALESIEPLRMDVVRVAIPMAVAGIACPTVTTCVLVGNLAQGQAAVPAVLYMTGSGAGWQVSVLPKGVTGGFSGVACPSAETCLAVGTLGAGRGFVDRLTLTATAARLGPLHRLGASLSSIACANATSCLVVGRSRRVLASPGEIQALTDALIEATSDGGEQWHLDQVVGSDGQGGTGRAYEQPWLPTVDGPLMFGGLAGVGCAPGDATRSCDVTWPFWPAAANTTDGIHWYPNVFTVGAVGGPGGSLSCPASGRCFAVGTKQFIANDGNVETATQILETLPTSPGWEWGIAGQGPASIYSPSLVAISCPTVSSCVAVGSWHPAPASSGSNPVYPLVMAPQLALHPFFQPSPPPWRALFTWQTLSLVLGAVSLLFGVGEVADVADYAVATENLPTYVRDVYAYVKLPYNFVVERAGVGVTDVVSFLSGALSTGIGAATVSAHDPLGWLAVGLGVFGLASWSASLDSLIVSGVDPTQPTPPPSTLPPELGATPTPSTTGEG